MRPKAAGFTLIELLVTLVILGIVASIALVAVAGVLDRSKQRATMADMRTLARAIEAYAIDHGYVPTDGGGIEGLEPLLIPYQINVVPTSDHWGNLYDYESNGENYSLESYGKDGVDGSDISVASRDDFTLDIVLADGRFTASPE